MIFILACLLAGSPLLLIELLTRHRALSPEVSRKLVHIFSALVVAVLPSFCTLTQIAGVGAVFLVIMIYFRSKKLWRSLYRIHRKSFGELYFPLAVLIAALIANNESIFITVILIMGVSDTLASIIGQRFGRRIIRLQTIKSLEGSLAFFISALIITVLMSDLSLFYATLSAFALALIEHASPGGTDNLTITVIGVLLLNTL